MRLSTLLAFCIMIVLGCGVYNVANRYEKTEKKLNAVQNKVGGEEEAIRVLQAEWTFLTSPDRLEKISAEYLHLQAVDGRQYVTVASIPMRDDMNARNQKEDALEQQVASTAAAPIVKQAVKQTVKQKVLERVAEAETEFEKVIAKELAPVATALPPATVQPLPTLQAMPVNATETMQ